VLLLADVFEAYRGASMKDYGLDSANYITLPGMVWDGMLRMTKATPHRLLDKDMYHFCEQGIRGGVCTVGSKRYAKANNPLCPDYNPNNPTTWIIDLDANNLYGQSLSHMLPYQCFKWVSPANLNIEQILATSDDANIGYFAEVDLHVPEELHDFFNDLPLAPESLVVQEEWLSDYQKKLQGESKHTTCRKLVPNLYDKEKYIVHYRLLKFYVRLGLCVTKLHRAIEFEQRAWMKPYIDFNTAKRKEAKSEFERNFYKLANNAPYGKSMENVRKRMRVDLVRGRTELQRFKRLVADPAFIKDKEFDGLFAIHSVKSKVTLDKPIYTGLAVLDLSKLSMYDFYYNEIKARYGDKVKLLYTDTDSLVMLIETADIYEDMWENSDLYDTSNYEEDFKTSKGHTLHSAKNKKVIGKFKDECGGHPIAEFVALRPKMYSFITADGEEEKRAKGVSRVVVRDDLRHASYLQCLREGKEQKHKMTQIRSDHHHLKICDTLKTSLSANDTKRFICDDGITTMAFGHVKARGRSLLDNIDQSFTTDLNENTLTSEPQENDVEELDKTIQIQPEQIDVTKPPCSVMNVIKQRFTKLLSGLLTPISHILQLFTNK